jgi:TolB-like protein
MKRCPQCKRIENDEALAFCRVDGTALINDSSAFDEAGTANLDVAPSSEMATSMLPHTTNAAVSRGTGPTTVLPAPATGTTNTLAKPNRRRLWIAVVVIATAVIAATAAVLVNSYFAKKSTKTIESIAVMPFVNEGGNADVEYLSDGMTETLISALSQLPNLNVKPRSTVFRYKGKESNPQTIGNELNVQAILNGRVVQRGQEVSLFVEPSNCSWRAGVGGLGQSQG